MVQRKNNLKDITDTVLVDRSPLEILGYSKQPPINHILSAYELKSQPELICHYHAAAYFPTQPTWIAAIKNQHYATWKGLTVAGIRRHFPESDETWKGHGRKVPS